MSDAPQVPELLAFERIEVGLFSPFHAVARGLEALASEIETRGLETPLVVWSCKKPEATFEFAEDAHLPDRFVLLDGHRRHAALARLRAQGSRAFEQVPVVRIRGCKARALEAQVSFNLHQEVSSPLDLAESLYRLYAYGSEPFDIAKAIHCPLPWVWRYLGFALYAAPELKQAVAGGTLSFELAWAFVSRVHGEQRRCLTRFRSTLASAGFAPAYEELLGKVDAGRRPLLSELRGQALAIRARDCPKPGTPLEAARAVLAWVLGEGDWPDSLSHVPAWLNE